MDKGWVRKMIYDTLAREVWSSTRKRPFMQVRGDWGEGATEAAEAIAAQHEAEVGGYKATIEELERDDVIQGFVQREELHQARLAAVRARVALMAGALRKVCTVSSAVYHEHHDDGLTDETVASLRYWWKGAEEALSGAPRVLWSGVVEVYPTVDGRPWLDPLDWSQDFTAGAKYDAILLAHGQGQGEQEASDGSLV